MRSPTRYKFRHYTPDPDGSGERVLAWASLGAKDSMDLRGDRIVAGSSDDLEVIEAQLWTPNALANEGEIDMLDVYFDVQAVRTNLYFGLLSAAPGETETEATMTELAVANGYARIAVARGTDWGVPAHDTGTVSATKQFSATGAWTGATDLSLSTSASGTTGKFIAWSALSQTRTLGNGDTLDVSMTASLE